MRNEELLKSFLDKIYGEINPASFHAWFNDLKIISLTDETITFEVPMEIHKKMLGDNYYSLIEKTLYDITNINYDIKFVLESELEILPKIEVDNHEVTNNNFDTHLKPELNFSNFVIYLFLMLCPSYLQHKAICLSIFANAVWSYNVFFCLLM